MKIYCLKNSNSSGFSITEFQVFGPVFDGSSDVPDDKDKLYIIILIVILSFIGFIVIIVFGICIFKVKRRKNLERRADCKIVHVKLNETTINRKKGLSKFGYLNPSNVEINTSKIKDYIGELKNRNEVKCYEIINNGDEFENYSQIKKDGKLGSGGFGQVWEVRNKQEQKFALKLFLDRQAIIDEQHFQSFLNMTQELEIIREINCPFIVMVYGIAYSFENNQITLGIVEEFVEMDLKRFLKEKIEILSLVEKVNIAINITNGLLEIHHKHFIHHDIKTANILITKKGNNFENKITDFGTCLRADNMCKSLNGISLNYGAPENILHCCFEFPFENTAKSDIWSLGIVFHEIFINNLNVIFPWSKHFTSNQRKNYDNEIHREIQKAKTQKNHYVEENTSNFPVEILKLINECLQVESDNRPSIDEILEILIHVRQNLNRFDKI